MGCTLALIKKFIHYLKTLMKVLELSSEAAKELTHLSSLKQQKLNLNAKKNGIRSP